MNAATRYNERGLTLGEVEIVLEKIDAAIVMCLAVHAASATVDEVPSVYEAHGIRVLG